MNSDSLLNNKINSIIELYSSGQISDALESIEILIGQNPNESILYNIRGVCLKANGKLEMAAQSFKSAINLKPNFIDSHYNLALTLQELNQLDAAVKSYKKTLSFDITYAKAYINLGIVFKELGQMEEAIESYEQLIVIQPDNAVAHHNLGNLMTELGEFDEAANCYKKAIAINPEHSEALSNLGNILKECGQFDEAIDFYKKALTVNPKFDNAHYNLGVALYKLGKTDKAIATFKQLLINNPNFADALNFLGTLFHDLGQVDEAINCYVNALAIEPDNSHFHYNFSQLKHYKLGDTQFTHMQSLISRKDLIKSDRIRLCFGLAKAYEDLGNKAELFKVLNEGNSLIKKELNYLIENDLKKHSIIRKLFKSVNTKPSYDQIAVRPIFIVGMPRSGTSLVEQIISSHHKVHGLGELNILDTIIYNYLSQSNALSNKDFFSIRKKYLDGLLNLNFSESIITDKMPINFENIGFILKAFPEAKIIHLKRDAMAVCWSIYKRHFSNKNLGFSYDMRDLAQFYNSYIELMDFWHELFPNQIYDIYYENLTNNQEQETRNLLDYSGLSWDENCLNFYTNKKAVTTASSLQVKEPMYQGSSEAWKKYETQLKLLIKNLGY